MSATPPLKSVLRDELAQAVERDRQRHFATPYGAPVYAYDPDVMDLMSADLRQVEADLADARRSLAHRDTIGIEDWIDEVMSKHGLAPEVRAELALGLAMVRVQTLEQSKVHLISGVTPRVSLGDAVTTVVQEPSAAVARAGDRLSELLPSFMTQMANESGWRGQTLMQNRGTYRIFIEVCGDHPVNSYRRPELAKTLDLFRRLPADYGRAKRWSGLPLTEVAAAATADDPKLAVKTMKRHFAALGSLFKYLIERGEYEGPNPAHGFSFPEKMRAKMKRQMWDGERLRRLFMSPVWTGCKTPSQRGRTGSLIIKDDKYWLPLLGLYHGNRLEEFAQLLGSDVRVEGGIWFLDINDEETKQVKNEQSKRRVPIHPVLLDLGFLEYVKAIAPSTSDPLFPKLLPGGADGKRGHAFSKWWTRYRRDVGVYEPGLDYHSFRHGVTTKLFAAEVPEVFVDELTGHEGKGTSRAVYTKEMPLRKLFEAICKVEWPEVAIKPG